MTDEQFSKEVAQKPKSMAVLWTAVLFLFLACASVIFGLWKSYENDRISNNLAMSNNDLIGEVLGTSTEDPNYIAALVENLKSGGVVLYGYDGNQENTKQLAIFGQAAAGLDYVECNPQSSSSNTDECVARGVDQYPTWVIGDQKFARYKTLEDLEEILNNQ